MRLRRVKEPNRWMGVLPVVKESEVESLLRAEMCQMMWLAEEAYGRPRCRDPILEFLRILRGSRECESGGGNAVLEFGILGRERGEPDWERVKASLMAVEF